ncbi:hypothetical protein R3P38DRAFT_2949341 [Favolaschia claudopus]|uniref:Secreted protein n=1 Tax=Favolaschia claudopus TaxID=2862362 RepID=A0AAW0BIQ6_9AGAR
MKSTHILLLLLVSLLFSLQTTPHGRLSPSARSGRCPAKAYVPAVILKAFVPLESVKALVPYTSVKALVPYKPAKVSVLYHANAETTSAPDQTTPIFENPESTMLFLIYLGRVLCQRLIRRLGRFVH